MNGLIDPQRHGLTWSDVSYRLKSAFAVILSIAVLVGGAVFVYDKARDAYQSVTTQDDYPGTGGDEVIVTIPRGATTYRISDILVAGDVIKSAKTFDQVAANDPKAANIQAGRYRLRKQMPARLALAMLLDPANVIKTKVTIPEGLTLKEVLDRLARPESEGGTGIAREEFQKVLDSQTDKLGLPAYAKGQAEGYLFPDTYSFASDGTALSILQQMVAQFAAVADELGLEQAAKNAGVAPQQIMTVASLVEAESRRDEDRGKVARVIYNRLDIDMPLQMDSTVHYAVGKTGTVFTSDAERQNPSPYNTYVHPGLPPGPIGQPGRKSIQAALSPTAGKWIYFVAVNLQTGETLFAVDQAEHIANTEKLRAWCAQNAGKC